MLKNCFKHSQFFLTHFLFYKPLQSLTCVRAVCFADSAHYLVFAMQKLALLTFSHLRQAADFPKFTSLQTVPCLLSSHRVKVQNFLQLKSGFRTNCELPKAKILPKMHGMSAKDGWQLLG